jgi:cyclopropane fatty-acyl-phospholipid synthase-like methyltransferase
MVASSPARSSSAAISRALGALPSSPPADRRTVVNCYSFFDKVFPACGLVDYTEGLYCGDESVPYDVAQARQINYVLDEVHCGPGTRLIEIGCGNGSLLAHARQRGAEAVGITICPEQVTFCERLGLDVRLLDYCKLDDDWFGRFDAVVANGPVEHFVHPEQAAAGQADAIYRRMFELFHRLIDPASPIRRAINTTIHFVRTPDPGDLLKNPWRFRWFSDEFHWSLLHRCFGGWYPVAGQLERCAVGLFQLVHTTDGTHDYHLTSEEWLRRCQQAFTSRKVWSIARDSLPFVARHPIQATHMLLCMLWSQSWNWQFRTANPPTRLLRQTWDWRPAAA